MEKYFEGDSQRTLIRIVIIAQFFLLFLSVVTSLFEEENLPVELRSYLDQQSDEWFGESFIVTFVFILASLSYFISGMAICLFKKWSRSVYFYSIIVMTLLSPFFGPMIDTPVSSMLTFVNTILIGSTLALILMPSARLHFELSRPAELESADEDGIDSPSITRRYVATFIDVSFIFLMVITSAFLFQDKDSLSQAIRLLIALFAFLVYEPLLTSRHYTIGQKWMGIRVRKHSNFERISVWSAYIRIIVKMLLGVVSFFSIPFNKDRRGVHDLVVGSVVIKAELYEQRHEKKKLRTGPPLKLSGRKRY